MRFSLTLSQNVVEFFCLVMAFIVYFGAYL